ncbi:hypothetical protein [Dictyobacter kobayashii]|nr:hypothetical protein [Dictyobacter kobayashii]
MAEIAERAAEAELDAPALTIIGSVVSVGEALAWYQQAHSSQEAE